MLLCNIPRCHYPSLVDMSYRLGLQRWQKKRITSECLKVYARVLFFWGNIRFFIIIVRVTSLVNKTEHGQPVLLLSFNRVNLLY